LEASSIAAGASGKAGGLLALWAYPHCLVDLSYNLHEKLATEHGGYERWGYRRLTGCGSVSAVVTKADLSPGKTTRGDMNRNGNGGKQFSGGDGPGERAEETMPGHSVLPVGSNGDSHAQTPELSEGWEKLPKQDDQAASRLHQSPLPPELDWIDPKLVRDYEAMERYGTSETSQVHPFHFTTAMAELAAEKGVDIRLQAFVRMINSTQSGVQSVEYEDRETGQQCLVEEVSDVVLCAGPWTGKLLPRSKIQGIRAHSIVYEAEVSPFAIFTNVELPSSWVPEHRARLGQPRKHGNEVDPEIYARPFNEVYACGETDRNVPLPLTADKVKVDTLACDDIAAYVGTISPVLQSAPVKAKQACYLPQHVRSDKERGPLVGPTSIPHLWVAAGHTCWGIQNGPATGCLMAEFVMDGVAHSADISILDPREYRV
jgi:glycine/D-amino acid oxidase-like deaminating enzyme